MVVEGNCSLDVVHETLTALKRNDFEAIYVKRRQQALKKILELILSKAVVGAGDSSRR